MEHTAPGIENPEPIDIKLDRGDYVIILTRMQTLIFLPLRGGSGAGSGMAGMATAMPI